MLRLFDPIQIYPKDWCWYLTSMCRCLDLPLERLRRMAADEQRSLADQAGRLVDAVELLSRGQS